MPKRKLARRPTSAKQVAASKRNLVKARIKRWSGAELVAARKMPRTVDSEKWLNGPDSKLVPTGKNTLLYHRTDEFAAGQIVKTKAWKSGPAKFSGKPGRSWFSVGGPIPHTAYYGKALLAVSVPRKMVKPDALPGYVSVANSVLKGRKVRRLS